jgi:hypothetical protein
MTTQHTPGPWMSKTYSTDTVRDAVGIYAGTLQVVPDIAGRSFEQCDANICLIAAAPDLLAALVELVANNMGQPEGVKVPQLDKARAAIAKATGAA